MPEKKKEGIKTSLKKIKIAKPAKKEIKPKEVVKPKTVRKPKAKK